MRRQKLDEPRLLPIVALAVLLPVAVSPLAPSARATSAQERFWIGDDGDPLPFRNDEEIKDFLRTAEVVDTESLPVGITDPLRVTLEQDGIRAHAVFRYFEERYPRARLGDGHLYMNFTDSFRFEPAAYEIARLLGMDNVPPAVKRRIRGKLGTVQMWVYHARSESERMAQGLSPPNRLRWERQRQQMVLFDTLIGNTDRNAGNVLIDGFWNMWLIDHTRAFYERARCDDIDKILTVERDLWDRLRALDQQTLEARLDGLLSGARIARLLDRKERLVAHINALIEERGEGAVVY